MNLFSAPTDSFYKFLAVGGLIIFIAGGVLLFQDNIHKNELSEKYWNEYLMVQNDIDVFITELDYNQKYKPLSDSLRNYYGNIIENIQPNDSISKSILYNLPDTLQAEFKELSLKKKKLELSKEFYDDEVSWNIRTTMIIIPLYLGEIIGLFGLFFWYDKIQKPIDIRQISEETQRYLQGEVWFENCQSCMKTFFHLDELGREKDGSVNNIYCKECYTDGVFVEPELTLKEALERLKGNLKRLNYSNPIERYYKIKKLKRSIRWGRERLW